MSTLAPFTAQRATLVDNGIGDGIVRRHSMTFQESFDKDFVDGNGEWWQWDYMMNVDENVDNLNFMWEQHASLSLETLPRREDMCFI